jgi:hypothetical protein
VIIIQIATNSSIIVFVELLLVLASPQILLVLVDTMRTALLNAMSMKVSGFVLDHVLELTPHRIVPSEGGCVGPSLGRAGSLGWRKGAR